MDHITWISCPRYNDNHYTTKELQEMGNIRKSIASIELVQRRRHPHVPAYENWVTVELMLLENLRAAPRYLGEPMDEILLWQSICCKRIGEQSQLAV